jgi:hypothetical protein
MFGTQSDQILIVTKENGEKIQDNKLIDLDVYKI